MFCALQRRARRGLVSGLLSVTALGVILAASPDIDFPASGHGSGSVAALGKRGGPCGPATSTAIVSVDEYVARRIYLAELGGYEVRADVARIAGYTELRTALQASNLPAIYAAVHAIVYAPHWHIVRLRVTQKGRVLADVGGPDIIAPVSGALRAKGKVIASFVMSVQDDLGYTKLVSRFIDVPIDLYRGGSLVMGTLQPQSSSPSNGELLSVGHANYRALVFDTAAFPTGKLKVALFVPAPAGALAARSCAAVRTAAWGSIAGHVASRFAPLSAHYEDFRHTLQGVSEGLVFVRSGTARLAGAGPSRLPSSGTVQYHGRRWAVYSFAPSPPARIYFLTPTTIGQA
ncbi:MAG TPA: hypothetical protein VIJ50_10335 [Solirubrobacteraceae bacterium]